MKTDSSLPKHFDSAVEATQTVRRRIRSLTNTTLEIFEPVADRTPFGAARFLKRCAVSESSLGATPSAIAAVITGGHMVQIGDPRRMTLELAIVRTKTGASYALYEPPPTDVRTLLPELAVVELNRARATLTTPAHARLFMSELTVDDVNHLIVLASTTASNEDDADGGAEQL
ncbi:MAG: hypothetical protein MUF54_21815, partial [Polyangiaceae bacterium]|nr:hypothetical protein [Polyangiaceae bacterium]